MRPSPTLFGGSGSKSSKQWLSRQFRDPYVRQRMSNPAQYRSRSAFKLLEMDAKYNFLDRRSSSSRSRIVVDLGAAPGGWSQVVALKMGYAGIVKGKDPLHPPEELAYGLTPTARMERQGLWSDVHATEDPAFLSPGPIADGKQRTPTKIIALDLLRIQPMRGVTAIQADFLSPAAMQLVRAHFPTGVEHVDVLLSDMATNASGKPIVDAENSLRICHAVWRFAKQHLAVKKDREPGGVLVLKHFVHPDTHQFRWAFLEKSFRRVVFVKPPSSRSESSEGYWICFDWLGPLAKVPPAPLLPINPPILSPYKTDPM